MSDFTRLKRNIEELKKEINKAEGSLVELKKQEVLLLNELKEEFNIDGLEEVEKEICKLDKEIKEIELKLIEKEKEIREIMR